MSSDRPRPDHDKEGVVIPMRPSAPTSDDLREYLPAKGVARGALFEAKGDADPALVAKLHEMNAAESARPSKPKVEATTEAKAAPAARTRRLRPWMVAAAVGAVALPVVVTIVAMRAEMRAMLTAKPAGDVAAPIATTAIGATASTRPTAEATATAAIAVSAAATTSTAAPAVPKHAPRPKATANAAAPSPHPSAAPTVAPDILP